MKKIIAFIALVAPSVAFAQTKVVDVNSLSTKLSSIGNVVVYLLVALAVIFIVWNTVIYVIKGSGEEGRSKAGMNILWGIVGLFVIVSIWGLIEISISIMVGILFITELIIADKKPVPTIATVLLCSKSTLIHEAIISLIPAFLSP